MKFFLKSEQLVHLLRHDCQTMSSTVLQDGCCIGTRFLVIICMYCLAGATLFHFVDAKCAPGTSATKKSRRQQVSYVGRLAICALENAHRLTHLSAMSAVLRMTRLFELAGERWCLFLDFVVAACPFVGSSACSRCLLSTWTVNHAFSICSHDI